MESSTTTSTPDLLLVVLLFLEHLSALSVVLLKTKLCVNEIKVSYSSKTVLSFELLNILDRIVDEAETSGTTTTCLLIHLTQEHTEGNLETKENNALLVSNLVLLGNEGLKVILRHRSTLGVNHLKSLCITTQL
jgi:hypothetical protein